jgi:hypothetical protein
MKKRLKTYLVTVEVRTVEVYQVEAKTPEDAMENWQDGELLKQDFSRLEAEPVSAEEKGARDVAQQDN